MGLFFEDPLFEELTTTLGLGLTSHGGPELGEVQATCATIVDGDDESWYQAWCTTGDRLTQAGGRLGRSRACGQRARVLSAGVRVLQRRVAPAVRRAGGSASLEGFRRQRAAFDKAAALMEPAGEQLTIGFDAAKMPAYLFRAPGTGAPRPLLVATSGYDSTIYDGYFGQAVPALRRGYHCLVFDGPGQGAVLFEQGIPIRADWDAVVRAVIDAALGREGIDPDRIVLTGWSLAGHLALRGACGESRLAACIADPGLLSIGAGMIGRLRAAGVPQELMERYPDIPDEVLAPVAEMIHADRALRWAVEQRGFWVHGVGTLAEYLRATAPFDLEGQLSRISCPTVVTAAEEDPLAHSAEQIYDALPGTKALLRFATAEGAGDHCEMRNRSLLDQRVFDWLDDILAA